MNVHVRIDYKLSFTACPWWLQTTMYGTSVMTKDYRVWNFHNDYKLSPKKIDVDVMHNGWSDKNQLLRAS